MRVPDGRSTYTAGHEEALLSANYTKKDRAAKQQALFPDLEKAIAEGREAAKMKHTIECNAHGQRERKNK